MIAQIVFFAYFKSDSFSLFDGWGKLLFKIDALLFLGSTVGVISWFAAGLRIHPGTWIPVPLATAAGFWALGSIVAAHAASV